MEDTSNSIEIRPYVGEDRAALGALVSALQEFERGFRTTRRPGPVCARELTDMMIGESAAIFLARSETQAVGFVSGRIVDDPMEQAQREMIVSNLFVRPGFRARGLGRRLLERMRLKAAHLDCRRLVIGALEGNPDAAALYRHMGFKPYYTILEQPVDADPAWISDQG